MNSLESDETDETDETQREHEPRSRAATKATADPTHTEPRAAANDPKHPLTAATTDLTS
jgi:hypothetical protein